MINKSNLNTNIIRQNNLKSFSNGSSNNFNNLGTLSQSLTKNTAGSLSNETKEYHEFSDNDFKIKPDIRENKNLSRIYNKINRFHSMGIENIKNNFFYENVDKKVKVNNSTKFPLLFKNNLKIVKPEKIPALNLKSNEHYNDVLSKLSNDNEEKSNRKLSGSKLILSKIIKNSNRDKNTPTVTFLNQDTNSINNTHGNENYTTNQSNKNLNYSNKKKDTENTKSNCNENFEKKEIIDNNNLSNPNNDLLSTYYKSGLNSTLNVNLSNTKAFNFTVSKSKINDVIEDLSEAQSNFNITHMSILNRNTVNPDPESYLQPVIIKKSSKLIVSSEDKYNDNKKDSQINSKFFNANNSSNKNTSSNETANKHDNRLLYSTNYGKPVNANVSFSEIINYKNEAIKNSQANTSKNYLNIQDSISIQNTNTGYLINERKISHFDLNLNYVKIKDVIDSPEISKRYNQNNYSYNKTFHFNNSVISNNKNINKNGVKEDLFFSTQIFNLKGMKRKKLLPHLLKGFKSIENEMSEINENISKAVKDLDESIEKGEKYKNKYVKEFSFDNSSDVFMYENNGEGYYMLNQKVFSESKMLKNMTCENIHKHQKFLRERFNLEQKDEDHIFDGLAKQTQHKFKQVIDYLNNTEDLKKRALKNLETHQQKKRIDELSKIDDEQISEDKEDL